MTTNPSQPQSTLATQEKLQQPSSPSEYILGAGDLIEIAFFRKPSAVQQEYRIRINDKIQIEFPSYPELKAEVVIPPDGKIDLKKVGQIQAVDLTPTELAKILQEAYSSMLTQPDLVVNLVQFYSPVQEFFSLLGTKGQLQEMAIRSDGKISLPFMNEIQAEGITPSALAQEIQSRLNKILPELEISISVKSEGSKKFLVLGEVKLSGMYQLSRQLTPLEAISLAGGYSDNAILDEVLIIRKTKDNHSETMLFDLKKALSNERFPNRLYLQPYDVVFVPKKKIVKIGVTLRQIYNLLPPYLGLGFGYTLNPSGAN